MLGKPDAGIQFATKEEIRRSLSWYSRDYLCMCYRYVSSNLKKDSVGAVSFGTFVTAYFTKVSVITEDEISSDFLAS